LHFKQITKNIKNQFHNLANVRSSSPLHYRKGSYALKRNYYIKPTGMKTEDKYCSGHSNRQWCL